jgi:cephalosporin hydroxylase
MSKEKSFEDEVRENIRGLGEDESLKQLTHRWMFDASAHRYTYNFRWLGRPMIQFPQDMIALQEIIWDYKPDLVVETGIAHGGSLIFHASILELLGHGQVLGIDIDIRSHNRASVEQHPMFKRIEMIEGSSIDPDIVARVYDHPAANGKVLVILDSNHTHAHVLQELKAYAGLVRKGGYIVVMDTAIEDAPKGTMWPDRPWGHGNNPKTAVWEFLKTTDRFEIDKEIENKLQITVAPDGYLKCVKD